MLIYFINFMICVLMGIVIGVIIRKNFNVTKWIDYITVVTLSVLVLVVAVVLNSVKGISFYNIRIYVPSTCYGLLSGWILCSWPLKIHKK